MSPAHRDACLPALSITQLPGCTTGSPSCWSNKKMGYRGQDGDGEGGGRAGV